MENKKNNLYQKILDRWGVILFVIVAGVFVLTQVCK